MTKKKLVLWAGMSVSIGFIGYAAANMDFRRAFAAILDIHPAWLLPLSGVFLLQFYLRALRLKYITDPLKTVSLGTLFSATAIGFMGNMVLPMRAGEVLRIYVVAKKENLAASGVVATVVVERLFDMLSMMAMLALTLLIAHPAGVSPEVWGKLKVGGIALAAIAGVAGVLIFLLSNEKSAASRMLHAFIGRLPEKATGAATAMTVSFRSGLQVFGRGGHFAATVLHSATLWMSVICFFLFALPVFGLPLSFEVACMVTVFVLIGVAVPSSPGFIGPYHAAVVFALGLYGVSADEALGIAIFIHAFSFAGTVGLGLYCAWREKLGFAELRHSAEGAQ